MRRALALLLLLGSARAEWSGTDTALEVVGEGLLLIDWQQTHSAAAANWPGLRVYPPEYSSVHGYYLRRERETNPLLGRHPSKRAVDMYCGGWVLIHPLVAALLPHGWWRSAWQAGTIGVEFYAVSRNAALGLSMRW